MQYNTIQYNTEKNRRKLTLCIEGGGRVADILAGTENLKRWMLRQPMFEVRFGRSTGSRQQSSGATLQNNNLFLVFTLRGREIHTNHKDWFTISSNGWLCLRPLDYRGRPLNNKCYTAEKMRRLYLVK